MSVSIGMHDATSVHVVDLEELNVASLQIMCDGGRVSIFMPLFQAQAMADAFNAHQPKPATDEAAE